MKRTPRNDKLYLDLREVADLLDVNPATVKVWCQQSLAGDYRRVRNVRVDATGHFMLSSKEVDGIRKRCAARLDLIAKNRQSYRETKVSKTDKGYTLVKGEFVAIMRRQKGRCTICGAKGGFDLLVDHCHKTGDIRGLLCARCNNGLGQFLDDQKLLARARRYILKSRN